MKKEKLIVDIIQKSTSKIPSNAIRNDRILRKFFDIVPQTGYISKEDYDNIMIFVEEFKLDKPQNLVKWLVDLHFAGIESINEGIANVRRDLLTSEITKIRSVWDKIQDIDCFDDRNSLLKQYSDELMSVISNIEGKISDYIAEIDRIDNLPRYKFFLQANFNKSKVTTSVQLTKAALQAYFEALNIQALIANERHGINSTYQKNYLGNKLDFIEKLPISLVYSYDRYKDEAFWNRSKLKGNINKIKEISVKLEQYLECNSETEIEDFEEEIDYSC